MRRLLLSLLVFVCATAGAQVYKRVGPDGKVYFSDQPGPGAEQIHVAPPQTISLPPVPEQTDTAQPSGDAGAEQQDDVSALYKKFSIVSPTHGQGVRANDGNVLVRLSLEPELRRGHTIRLTLDGEDGEDFKTGGGMTIPLTNLSRGLHTVEATVVDHEGNALIRTGPISFNVLRVAVGG